MGCAWRVIRGAAKTARSSSCCTAAGRPRHAWRGTGETLAAGYRAVALDARGHGDSGWDADGIYGPNAVGRGSPVRGGGP